MRLAKVIDYGEPGEIFEAHNTGAKNWDGVRIRVVAISSLTTNFIVYDVPPLFKGRREGKGRFLILCAAALRADWKLVEEDDK